MSCRMLLTVDGFPVLLAVAYQIAWHRLLYPAMQQQPQEAFQPSQEPIAVVLPKGIKPGNKMKVKLADGTMKEFKVPAGAKAGQTIEFTVKAVL